MYRTPSEPFTLPTDVPPTDFSRRVYAVIGLPIDAVNMQETVAAINDAAEKRKPCFLSTPNLNFAIGCIGDPKFRNSVIFSNLSIADGMPLVWIARLLGIPLTERVAGSGLMEQLRIKHRQVISIYLFGGPEGVAAEASRRMNAVSSGIRCVGECSPGFGSLDDISSDAIIDDINASKADFLLVALGAKKGQAWILKNRHRLNVPVVSHLGAVINFLAGSVRRAPPKIQKLGLEWLWRIKEEPNLWRRYFGDGMALLHLLLTRLLPGAVGLRLLRPGPRAYELAGVRSIRDNNRIRICLDGAWNDSNLAPLRQCFDDAIQEPCAIELDMTNVIHVDCAFVGLAMLMYGHQAQHGESFVMNGVGPRVRRIFRTCCADFLLEQNPAGSSDAAAQEHPLASA